MTNLGGDKPITEMRLKTLFAYTLLALAFALASCNVDETFTADPEPVIKVEGSNAFEVKVGGEVTLSPEVEYADGAEFEWSIDGRTVATSRTYKFKAEQVGTFYITLRVSNAAGSDRADFRIEVLPIEPPVVSLAVGADGRMELLAGKRTTLLSSVAHSEGAEYEWLIDGKKVGAEPSLSVQIDQSGEYALTLKVRNEDGVGEASARLCVVEKLTKKIEFINYCTATNPSRRYVSLGRELHLSPLVENFSEPTFVWSVDGEVVGHDAVLRYEPATVGECVVEVVVTDADGTSLKAEVVVECCAEEGAFRREPTAESAAECNQIFEYTPAAGQFINEPKSGFAAESTAEAAVAYATKRFASGSYVSLGGWGGYIVVGFDHSISNGVGNDIIVKGNMHEGSSEAGIVWVSQDSNGNGQPDDEWYELRGSEWESPTTWRDYAVTYYAPAGDKMDVLWRDNRGEQGRIARVDAHPYPSYYPVWVGASSFTLYGTRLESRTTVDEATGNYVNAPFAWGYADNIGSDVCADNEQSNAFDISNAVTAAGLDAELQYVDFVKVQSAINATAGHLGELSTEVCGISEF